MQDIQERVKAAVKNYISLAHEDYEYVGSCSGFEVYDVNGDLAFINIVYAKGKLEETNKEDLKDRFEQAAAYWLSHADYINVNIICSEISLNILGDNRALLRHEINVLGG